jgi:hypothetical protein
VWVNSDVSDEQIILDDSMFCSPPVPSGHVVMSSSFSWQRQFGHISFKSEDTFRKFHVNPINTRLQIPEDNHSLISIISQVTRNALCSLCATHIKANNSLEVKFTNAFALFYFSDFHLQF